MEKTDSSLRCKLKGAPMLREYSLQQQVDQLEKQNMSLLYTVDSNSTNGFIKSYCIVLIFNTEESRQTLKKITKLAPQLPDLGHISLENTTKNKAGTNFKKYCTKLLRQIKGGELNDIAIKGKTIVTEHFSFYARSVLRLVPMVTAKVSIVAFRISHKAFGRILMSCNNTQALSFCHCTIYVDNLDYLDRVGGTKDGRPLIKHLRLCFNKFIQLEEDNEYLEGLVQKMADSKLNTCLLTVNIYTVTMVDRESEILVKREYKIGNFDVTIY